MTLSEAIRSGQSSREVMKLEKIAVGSPFSLFLQGTSSGTESVVCRNKKGASMNEPVDVGERDGRRLVAHGAGDVALVGWLGGLF